MHAAHLCQQQNHTGDSRESPLFSCSNLSQRFVKKHGLLRPPEAILAVRDVSFDIKKGETVGLVGESGCGKSTLAKMLVGLTPPTAGHVYLLGNDLYARHSKAFRASLPQLVQMIFQDPYSSLNPRMRVAESVREPLAYAPMPLPRQEQDRQVAAILEKVGISQEQGRLFPHEFSGGQRQRIAIARALVSTPGLVVSDEPTSSLDASVQAQILNLLMDLQEELGVSYLFISHDLTVVRHMSDRILVMYAGEVVEEAPAHIIFTSPRHPYTQLLLDAMPGSTSTSTPLLEAAPLAGKMQGCLFAPRCMYRATRCFEQHPDLFASHNEGTHTARCFFPLTPATARYPYEN